MTAVNANIPFSVLLELTYRCNLDGYYCYNDRASTGQPLSVAQYGNLLEALRELGTMQPDLQWRLVVGATKSL